MSVSITALRKPLAMAAVTALTLGLVACSGPEEPATLTDPAPGTVSSAPAAAPSSPASPSTSPSASASPSPSATAPGASNDALLAAGRLGATEVSKGTVTSIESERSGWEVHVVTANGEEQQLRTDAAGEQVVSGPTDDRADAEDRAENQEFAKADVDYREAVTAVDKAVDGAQVGELSLDSDNGQLTWEADVSVGSEQRSISVDAADGRVVSNRLDD